MRLISTESSSLYKPQLKKNWANIDHVSRMSALYRPLLRFMQQGKSTIGSDEGPRQDLNFVYIQKFCSFRGQEQM